MQAVIIFTAILAVSSAAPLILSEAVIHTAPAKSTLTSSSQFVNHGSTYHAVPVLHTIQPSKTTVTKSSQLVNHGGTSVVHTPVHYPVSHYMVDDVYHSIPVSKSNQIDYGTVIHSPVVPAVHSSSVLVHSSPLVTVKSGDSAVSHHSSTVHETVPVVKSLPVYAVHH